MKFGLRFCLAAIAVTAFSACGGGGSSSPAPVASTAPLLPKVVERSDVQSGLAVLGAVTLFAEFTAFPGGSSSINGSCAQSSTQTFAPTGPVSYTVVVTQYYDTACTRPHVVINGNMRDSTTGSLFATKTIYSRGGSTIGYDTIEVTASHISSQIGVAITVASAAGGQTTTRQNLLCTRGQTYVCDVASTTNLIDGSMIGASFVLTIHATALNTADVLSVTSPVKEYASSTGGLTVGTAANTLTVGGSPVLVSTSLTGSVQTVTNTPSDLLSNSDATFGDTVEIVESSLAVGTTIGITAGTGTLGSGKLDADGNGTITYSDGSQSVVAGLNLTT